MHEAFDMVVSDNIFTMSVKIGNALRRQMMKNGKGEVAQHNTTLRYSRRRDVGSPRAINSRSGWLRRALNLHGTVRSLEILEIWRGHPTKLFEVA